MHEIIRETAALLKAVAWPLVALFALWTLRVEIQSFLAKLAETLSSAAQIEITAKGLQIKYDKKIAALTSQVTAIGAVQSQVTESVYKAEPGQPATDESTPSPVAIPKALRKLAADYDTVKEADPQKRVRIKNKLALQMGDIVLRDRVSRQKLAQEPSEALYVALAAAAAADPQAEDLERLLGLAGAAKRLHVRYRIVVSLGVLINKGLVRRDTVPRVSEALRSLSAGADEPLLRIIKDTESAIAQMVAGELVFIG